MCIRDSPSDEDGTIEELHRYCELMRGSQINMGLHIFGYPPKDPRRLAEYVAAAMTYDSRLSPSIRRVLAEALGFDYERLRKKPLEITEGRSNREILEILSKIARGVLERLISEESMSLKGVKDA